MQDPWTALAGKCGCEIALSQTNTISGELVNVLGPDPLYSIDPHVVVTQGISQENNHIGWLRCGKRRGIKFCCILSVYI